MFKKKENNLEKILDICLDRILIEGESIDNCLADYPEYSDELKSLLDVSIKTHKAVISVEAPPDFKSRLKYILETEISHANTPKQPYFRWKLQWAPVALSLCIVLLLSGGGTVAAASNSMPDNPLYNVKLASEQAQLFFTFDNTAKANLYQEFVSKRVNEIVVMASANNVEAINKSSKIMQNQLAMIDVISQENLLVTSEETEGEFVLGISTTTVTETLWTGSEITTTSDKYATHTQTTDPLRHGVITITKTVTGGGDTYLDEVSQFIGTPPAYVSNIDNQLMVDMLYKNLIDLYTAAANNSGIVLESIIEAIKLLEDSYNIATGNIN